jgi:glycosyltransferase involved in cell wall biosynthesis
MKPKVSVIIPTYNRKEEIVPTLKSVLNQNFASFEVIVVNDNEDEKVVLNILNQLSDDRIKYLKNQRRKGANGARNTGLENARGKYVAFLDDDDLWNMDKLEKQIRKFDESVDNVGFVYSGFEVISRIDPTFSKKILPSKKGDVFSNMIQRNFVGSPTPLIKKSVFSKSGYFDENLLSAQDWELWIRMSAVTHFEYVDEVLAKYVVHGDQLSIDFNKKRNSIEYILQKHKGLYDRDKTALALNYKKIAVIYFMTGDLNTCRHNIKKAIFIIKEFRLDLIIHLILTFFPSFYRIYINHFIVLNCGNMKLLY